MSQPEITMYSAGYCGFCQRAKYLLEGKGVSWREIEVDHDRALRLEMVERSGRRTVPQIWIGEQHIGGFDDLYALERSGQLDELLAPPDASSAA